MLFNRIYRHFFFKRISNTCIFLIKLKIIFKVKSYYIINFIVIILTRFAFKRNDSNVNAI